jgi:streptogramin lyase
MMKAGLLSLVACLACCVVGLVVSPVIAFGEEGSPSVEGSGASSLLGGALVTSGSPTQGEQAQAAEEAKLANPEAVKVREESRTKFEGLNTEQAIKVAGEAFPKLVDEPAGGPPKLPAGQSITGYLTNNAASVDVGGGMQAVLESTVPIAIQRPSGELVPVALGLRAMGSVFEPSTPMVGVRIPKQLSDGVALPGVGVTVTPVNGAGASLGGAEGVVDGATVLYANTQTDTDSLVKPTTDGFEADTLLRSVESPQQLFFRVGLPAGASLVQAKDGSGVVDVVKEGTVIATVLPPGALDAAGTSVPVSMSVSGDTLVLGIEDRSIEYQYPVEVDPTFIEEHFTESGSKRSNWQWETSSTSRFASKPTDDKETKELSESSPASLETYGTAAYAESEKAYWAYQTQGDSKIYEFTAETEAKNTEDHIESFLELEAKGTGAQESKELLSDEAEKTAEYARKPAAPICPKNSKGEQECTSTAGGEGNAVRFQQSVVNKPTSNYAFSDSLYKGEVYLSEPAGTHATTKYNSSTREFSQSEVEKATEGKVKEPRANALYGSSNWLSEYDGALELIAEDPGIGVSATRLEYESSPGVWEQVVEHNYLTEGNCTGVQCNPKHTELGTLNKRLPNGEDKIRYRAEDAMGAAKRETESLPTEGTATVKVDYSKPHGIFISGLPYGNELSEGTYELTTYATDGESSTVASSGIMGIVGKEKGIALYVDGYEAEEVGTQAGCSVPKGECTASAKWRISGQKLGAGHHAIVVVAKDRAGNEGRDAETISVRHSTPVPLGPGSVDLESGDFTLGPSDVSLGSGLSVSRVYSSRDLTAGVEGGSLLGPQWSLSVGSEETLAELVDGSVLVTSGNGGETIFAAVLNSKQEPTGKFEAPPGDANLTMTIEENEKKEKLAYYLKDPAAGSSTKFTLSSTAKVWVPTDQEGLVPTDKVEYFYETAEVGGKKVTRPKEERGATPAKVSCAPKMEPGCRALKFTYATKTKSEISEGPSEWGEYEGRLVKVSYEGYNPATKKMTEAPVAVAEYAYDKQGRLRAEWDPRITPALKTEYGYDAVGHVTALNPSGQEPWVFTYGTTVEDSGTGRLLRATEAPASAGLWNGQLPQTTESEAPKLTGTPVVGVTKMSVSHGTWSNGPIAYGYQWEDCNTSGAECAPIVGATNSTYVPVPTDGGHTLVVQVSALNGGGVSVVATAASSAVKSIAGEYDLPKGTRPSQITSGPDGNLWFTSQSTSTISKVTTSGVILAEYALPKGSEPYGITTGSNKNLWFTEAGTSKIGEITTSGTITEYVLPSGSKPKGIASGSNKNLWFTETGTNKIGTVTTSGKELKEYTLLTEKSEPTGITAGPAEGELWFTDVASGKIGRITTAGAITEYEPSGGANGAPNAIVTGSDKNLWFTEPRLNEIGKITAAGTSKLYSLSFEGYEGEPNGIAAGSDGNLWFTHGRKGSEKLGKITTAGVVTNYEAPDDSLTGITAGPKEGELWFTGAGQTEGETRWVNASVGKITTSGVVTNYSTQTSDPRHIVAGPEGDLWFTDSDTSKIGKITTAGVVTEYSVAYGSDPTGITVGPEGDLWFAEEHAHKYNATENRTFVGKITPAGAVTEYAFAALSGVTPCSITAGADGNLWVLSYSNGLVAKVSPSGGITDYKLPVERQMSSITSGPEGDLWFVGGKTVERMTTAGVVTAEYAIEGSAGQITTGPEGNLWVADGGEKGVARVTPQGEVTYYATKGEGPAKLEGPSGITVGPDKQIWYSARGTFGTVTPSGTVEEYPMVGEPAWGGIAMGSDGNVWLTEAGEGGGRGLARISKVIFNAAPSETSGESGWTVNYDVPVSGTGAPHNMSTSEVAKWGQKAEEAPEEATAIFPPDSPQGWPASSYTRATVYYLDKEGRVVNTATPSTGTYGSISTTEYNETNDAVRTLSPDNRATALKEGCESESNCASATKAKLLSTENTYNGEGEKETEVSEPGTRLILSRGPEHMVKYVAGEEHYEAGEKAKEAMARSLTKYFYNEGAPTENPRTKKREAYDLVTTAQNYAQLINGEGKETETQDVSERKTSYSGQEDLGWELRAPTSVTTNPESLNLTATTEYYETGEATGEVKETRGPEGSGGNSAHDSKIIDYTLEENKEGYPGCGKHAEWAGLACETLPAKQPETPGVPNLPETTTTYNIWNEPETIVETFPKSSNFAEHTRTTKDEYDAAGRLKTSEKTSTATTEKADEALPMVTEEYNEQTGLLEKQSTKVGEKAKTITSKYNTLGQLESYTDADGNVAKFKYAGPEKDGLLEEMSDSSDNGESNQKLTYNETTKQLEKLVDSAAGTFTASYDTEGKLASEVYPNGMCASYTNNSVGEVTHIEYTKTSSCSEKEGVWFSEARVPSIRGEIMSRTSTLASEAYAFDQSGRLTEVQETPTGEYCKMRIYLYDKESNRTKLTTREPNGKKECATEGGTIQEHTYDEADRLTDSGIEYDPLGNVTKLPSGDAEGHALESAFYVDNAVATQTQNGVTNDYYMDPAGRVRETITGARKVITHYDGAGEAVAWACEGSEKAEACETGGKWTRNIPGIDGTLAAVQNGTGALGETPILQLHDLQGDVVATINDKTGETELVSKYNSTEFGAPNGGKEPPKFAWLGAGGVEKALASGVVTEGATSYVPQTGRALQSEAVAPPGLPDGSGAGASYIFQEEPWVLQGATREADEAPGLEAGREREAEEAACRAAPESCSEDPYWSGDVSIKTAAALSGALLGIEVAYYLSDGTALELAEKALEIVAEHLNINFLSKLKEVVERGLFGYSLNDVAEWVFHTGGLLQTCYEAADNHQEHPKNPHCWLSITTTVRHAYKGGPGMEIPNFGVTPEVGYCPWGTYSECLIVNDW